jgi:hypothetical protein
MKLALLLAFLTSAFSASAALTQHPSPTPAATAVHEKKDAAGRVISRITFRPDGTLTHHARVYGEGAEVLTVEEDLDRKREPIRQFREQMDVRGRPVEREETTTVAGRKVTKKTKFKYDAKGRQTAETQSTE